MSDTSPTPEAMLEELREAGQNHRLHVTLMFGQITVFLAASGGLLSALLGTVNSTTSRMIGAVGMLVTFVFLVHHERVYAYSLSARDRAIRLQDALGLNLYRDPPRPVVLPIRATTASRMLYLTASIFWAFVLARGASAVR